MPTRPLPVPDGLPPASATLPLGCVALHPADRPGPAEVRSVLTRA